MAPLESQETKLVFAADLGGTHLRAAAIDENGQIYHHLKKAAPNSTQTTDIVRVLIEAARECESKAREHGVIQTTSVAVAGTVNVDEGVVLTAPNIPCLAGFRLAEVLQTELNKPAIIENDANAAAIGEMWQGAACGARTIVCMTLGTGVGGGIILDGKLWRGADGSAGEIGHMAVEPLGGVGCACGSQGCLEVYASATAIVRMIRDALPRYPHSILHTSEDLTAEKVYRAAQSGDELAADVFHRMGIYLGIGLANLVNILNPEMIVIAGGVANGWDLFAKEASQQMRERAFPLPASRVRIKRGECGDDAGLLGAARLAFNPGLSEKRNFVSGQTSGGDDRF
jgi:glucokinase